MKEKWMAVLEFFGFGKGQIHYVGGTDEIITRSKPVKAFPIRVFLYP